MAQDIHAQDSSLNLPEGALARFGSGFFHGRGVAYSPDGTWLAVATTEGVQLYDARTLVEGAFLQGHTGIVYSVFFSGIYVFNYTNAILGFPNLGGRARGSTARIPV